MKFRKLSLSCECGHYPTTFDAVGLTPEYELVIRWRCEVCDKPGLHVKTLADCCRECPESEEACVTAAAYQSPSAQVADMRFLQSLGIRFADDRDR